MGYTAHMKIKFFIIIAATLLAACAPAPVELALTPETPNVPTRAIRTPTPEPIALPTGTPAPRPTSTPAPTPTQAPAQLTLWENLPPAQQIQLATDIAGFQGDHPNAKIIIQHYDDPAELVDGIVSNRVDFDIILGASNTLAPLQQSGKLQTMDAFFPPSFMDAFAGVTLIGATADGETWGLPDVAGFHLLLFYNRNLIDTPPTTITALELAATSVEAGTVGLVMNTADPLWLLPWIHGGSGTLVDETGHFVPDTQALASALETYARLVKIKGETVQTYTESRQMFLDGKAMMLMDGDWMVQTLRKLPALSWGVATLPASASAPEASPLVLARYWAVSAETSGRRAETAAQLLEYLVTSERQLKWASQFSTMPTRRDALNAPEILTSSVFRADAAQMQMGQGVPLGVDANDLLDAMRQPLADFVAGDSDIESTAANMKKNLP